MSFLSNLHIHTKDRSYTLYTLNGAAHTMDGNVAQSLIRRNPVTRFRANRVTLVLPNGRKAWLTPTNPSRGSAFRLVA